MAWLRPAGMVEKEPESGACRVQVEKQAGKIRKKGIYGEQYRTYHRN